MMRFGQLMYFAYLTYPIMLYISYIMYELYYFLRHLSIPSGSNVN